MRRSHRAQLEAAEAKIKALGDTIVAMQEELARLQREGQKA